MSTPLHTPSVWVNRAFTLHVNVATVLVMLAAGLQMVSWCTGYCVREKLNVILALLFGIGFSLTF